MCTGCDLCLPPCPVDCIDMVEVPVDATETPSLKPLVTGVETRIKCGDCEPVCPQTSRRKICFGSALRRARKIFGLTTALSVDLRQSLP